MTEKLKTGSKRKPEAKKAAASRKPVKARPTRERAPGTRRSSEYHSKAQGLDAQGGFGADRNRDLHLSKVENQRISLTYDNLIRLAVGLNVDVAELFSDAAGSTNARRSIARHGSGDKQATANYEYHYLNGDLKNKKMIPIYTVHKCHSIEEFGEFVQHDGEEFIYVLKGTIEVHTKSYLPVRLEQGDGIYIDSRMPHAYISIGDEDAIALGICTSPERSLEEPAPARKGRQQPNVPRPAGTRRRL